MQQNFLKNLLTNRKIVISLLVAVSFLIRYFYIDKSNFKSVAGGDQTIYLQLADNLARDGIYVMEPGFRSFFPPMHPWLMSLVIKTFGKSVPALYIFYFIMSSLTLIIIFKITQRLWGDIIGLFSALLFMIYEEFIYWTTHLYTETPYIFFFALTLYFLLRYTGTKKISDIILSGVFWAATFYTRSTVAVIFPFALVHLYLNAPAEYNFKKKTFILLAWSLSIFLILMPWGLRNQRIHKKFFLTTTNGGMNFLQGNNDWAHGEKTFPPQLFPEPNYHQRPNMTEVEQDKYFYKEGIKWIKADIPRFIRLVIKKWEYMLIYKVDQSSYEDKVSAFGRKMFFLLNWPYILTLGAIGIIFTIRDFKKISVFYGSIIATFITNGLYYPAQRYRLSMDVVLLIWAGAGVYYLLNYTIAIINKCKIITVNSLLLKEFKLNTLPLKEILGEKVAKFVKIFLLIVSALFIVYIPFAARISTIIRLNRGEILAFDPRQWKSGPSKFEGDHLFFPWPSLIRERIYLPKGKYTFTITADGEEFEGARGRLRLNINSQDIKTVTLENSLMDYNIDFDWKGGAAHIIVFFDRNKEETVSIYSIKIKKID